MNFWDFASAHPVALFFCILAIGWGLANMFHGHEKDCKCDKDNCCKN